jgi:hypothetical protein
MGGMEAGTGQSGCAGCDSGPIASDAHEMLCKLIFQGGVYSGCLTMRIEYDLRRFAETDITSLADAIRFELLKVAETVVSE